MHKQFLRAALKEAFLGRGLCAPNPPVGAVAVQNNEIIAQAWHQGAGTLHAEPLLLAQFAANTPDVTLYVTLEPCNHWGRTPPCVDAIIRHGISRVVYAYRDPDLIVSAGDTPHLLQAQGIEVLHVSVPEIDQFYQSYQHWVTTGKPWVTAKIAQTFDGKIAGHDGARMVLSNARCAAFTHEQRRCTDVILTTAKTLQNDNPMLTARIGDQTYSKVIAILDTHLTLSPYTHQAIRAAKHCHIYHDKAQEVKSSEPNVDYHGIALIDGQLDLHAVVSHLGSLGYHDVWVEAGGTLFSALHCAKLVNRTYVYLVPKTLSLTAPKAYVNDAVLTEPRAVSWQAMDDNMMAMLEW